MAILELQMCPDTAGGANAPGGHICISASAIKLRDIFCSLSLARLGSLVLGFQLLFLNFDHDFWIALGEEEFLIALDHVLDHSAI